MPLNRKRIVIVGAGFAGLTAATAISRRYAVTVIDPSPEFVWTPNIHEVLSGVKEEREVVLDSRTLIERAGHRYVQTRAASIDFPARQIHTEDDGVHGYEACLLAPGADRDRGDVPGARRHATAFRNAEDAAAIEQRLAALAARGRPYSVVIIGAGISGIEALGEILRRHRSNAGLAVHVVEREGRILPDLPAVLGDDVRERCAGQPVRWHTGAAVSGLKGNAVTLATGETLASDLTIWSAGLAPAAFLREAGLVPRGGDWVPVRPTLQSDVAPEVFVAGDSAGFASPLRKQAYHAIDMGQYAAWNIQHYLRGRPLKDFRAAGKPLLISLGDLDTYLVTGTLIVAGPWLAAAKESVYQFYMARFSLGLPPARIAVGAVDRAAGALRRLVLPELLSCANLGRARGTRTIHAAAS